MLSAKNKATLSGGEFLLFNSGQYYFLPIVYLIAIFVKESLNNAWFIIFLIFFGVPLLDHYISLDLRNPNEKEMEELEGRISFKIPVYFCIFIDWMVLLFTCKEISQRTEFDLIHLTGMIFGN